MPVTPATPTARATPGGLAQISGFPTQVTIAADTDIEFWEKAVTPPGYDGGEPIDITTMFNTVYRTKSPGNLIEVTPISITAAWDPILYTSLLSVINVSTVITVTFPDGSTVALYGYVQKAEPQEVSKEDSDQPEIAITIQPTSWDGLGFEAAPVVAEVSGTP